MIAMDFHEWFLEKYHQWSGGKKSVNQFASYLKIKQPTVNAWIAESRGQPQSAEIINKLVAKFGEEVFDVLGMEHPQPNPAVSIPMFGKIAAGMPIALPRSDFRLYDPESTITVLRQWLPANIDPAGLFALIVEGDSMKGEAIHDGDTLVMRKAETADNGDLVAVRLDEDDSVTLKKIYRENGTIRLQPANPKMKPIIVPAGSVHIEGKMVLLIRRMS